MTVKLLTLLLALLTCLLPASAAAGSPCGNYQVAFYDHGALNARQADGHWRGIDTDVVNELARRTGCRLTLVLESRVRIWSMLQAGRLDMSVSGIATPEREVFARFIPYLVARNSVLLSSEVDPQVQSLAALAADPRYRVAVVKGFRHGPVLDAWLNALRAQGRVYQAADFSGVMRLVKNARVHAIVALETSWRPLRADTGAAGLRVMDWAQPEPVVGSLVLSRARIPDATAARLGESLDAMRRDGTLEAIFARYMGAETAATMLLPIDQTRPAAAGSVR